MAILRFTGWETGDLVDGTTTGTVEVQTTVKRTGEYALRANPTTTNQGRQVQSALAATGARGPMNEATLYVSFYFRYATRPTANDEEMCFCGGTVGAQKFTVRLNSSGYLAVYDSANTLLATGTVALVADTWYRVDVKVGTGATGAWQVDYYSDVATPVLQESLSGTGNLTTGNATDFRLGKNANRNGETVDFFYDDYCADSAAFPGVGRVIRLDPDGTGAYTAWTGDNTDVDDYISQAGHDTDTTYVTTSTSGAAETESLESGASAGLVGTPLSVESYGMVRDEGGASAFNIRLRSGTTDDDTTNNDPGATYILRAKIYNTDPADAGAWTAADLDGLEVGVEANAAVAHRCTVLAVMVWEDGVAVGGGEVTTAGWKTLMGVGA